MSPRARKILSAVGTAALALVVAAGGLTILLAVFWLVHEDERPPWLPLDGRTLNIAAYPELFETTGSKGDGKTTFQLPEEAPDIQANDRFGVLTIRQCVATRQLQDKTPAGTVAWCGGKY
jgi:hypothetical protein